MTFNLNLIFVLLLNLFAQVTQVYTKCSEINSYENGLPLSITKLANDDYIGMGATIWHTTFLNSLKYWSNYSDPKNCVARLIRTSANFIVKYSLRPRGCCTHCCQFEKVEDYLTVYMYSKGKPVERIKMSKTKKPGRLTAFGFNSQLRTVLVISGFGDAGYDGAWFDTIFKVISKNREQFNVLMLDYSDLAPLPWYQESVDNVKLIAKAVTDFLIFYHKSGDLQIEKIHITAASLGAQIAGHIGRQIRKFKKLGRITGLDPAFPLYDQNNSKEYIYKGDAEFVDIIHTTSGIFGVRKPTGDADFFIEYPPGTISRPGCNLLKLFERGELANYLYICDHIRSVELYLDTILNPHFLPVCKNITTGSNSSEICGYVGFRASKNTTIGEYHLSTPLDWDPLLLYNVD